jgi:hypothetical protein
LREDANVALILDPNLIISKYYETSLKYACGTV